MLNYPIPAFNNTNRRLDATPAEGVVDGHFFCALNKGLLARDSLIHDSFMSDSFICDSQAAPPASLIQRTSMAQVTKRQVAKSQVAKSQVAKWRVAKWYDRKFEFSFPVELYPDLCVRLRGTPARLEEMVRGCPAERLVRATAREMPRAIVSEIVPETVRATTRAMPPAAEGKWSAQEHAGHMLNLEPLWLARVEDYLGSRDELSVADLSNRGTFEARYNERALPEILAAFRRARLTMVDRLERVDTELFGRTLLHPRLKTPMRLVDHLFFVAEHDDHHLAIIWGMIRA